MRILIAAALMAGMAAPAWGASCPTPAGWSKPERHLAARTPAMKFALKPGASSQIGLLPQEQVKFVSGRPARRGYAGLAAIDVPKAGTLQVVLGNRTYIDLVRGGKTLDLAGEPGGRGCPGIAKALEFKVQPGRYVIQLSGSPDRSVRFAASLR